MPPVPINPHNAGAPDYTLEHFRAVRQPLINDFQITHDQATQHLTAMWEAQNILDREDTSIKRKVADASPRKNKNWKEEWKKNHNKFLPYNKVPIASTIIKLPSPLTLCKLKKGDYVELYYFTNKGLAEAEASSHLGDNDAFALTCDKNSNHAFIPITVAKVKDLIIPDKDLTWVELDEAAPNLLQAMCEDSLDEEQVCSHLQMWMALSTHEY
ncbi:hypothetical protein PAXRUDRAFT_16663 [Paxillus rubicundulus Ve08.2h10]|uniref:Uncharacterized protein n=1 Tax=Paxillus rubicundulus Ve08.2h10 TaxID=930991 RepID=A0A0D0C714_9AGAM|nr:hypothetical protein PAXRUDRAFT_16663 [Paxillus rubicundulus Ve08.2h10]